MGGDTSNHMRHYLYRAKFLLILYILTAMLLNLGSMAYMKHLDDFKAFPQLTSEYAVGTITSGESNIKSRKLLMEATSKGKGDYLLAVQFAGIQGFAIYYTKSSCFSLSLKEGRLFRSDDFQQGKNTVLVNESTRRRCITKDGITYWNDGGSLFQVIGVYSDVDLYGDQSPDCFLNFCAKQLDDAIFNSFLYDAGQRTIPNLKVAKSFAENQSEWNSFRYAQIQSQAAEEFRISGTSFTPMFMMLLLTAVLIVLNSVSAIQGWLMARKAEIAVRKMVGASNYSSCCWIGKNLVSLIMLAFGGGALLSKLILEIGLSLPTKESVQLMFGIQIQGDTFFYGFLGMLLLCSCTAAITLWHFQKSEIARILACVQ